MRHLIGIAILCLVVLMVGTCSCSVQKHIVSENKDSSVIKEYQDSVRILTTENNKLFSENLQLQYLGVKFDTLFVKGDTIRNTVTIHDGNIEASGRIISASVSKTFYSSLLASKDRTIDSLSKVKAKETVKVVTEYKDRTVKKTFIPWWVWLIGLVLLAFNFRKQIKSIIWTT